MKGARAVPWAVVGFLAGAALGMMWGQKAKGRLSEAVSTEFEGGVFRVEVDTLEAAKAGLPDFLNRL